MKATIKYYLFLTFLLVGTSLFFTQCSTDDEDITILDVDNDGNTHVDGNALQDELDRLPKEDLSAEERAGLSFMREEEKLAHDVYISLYSKWGTKIFTNIAASEQTHTDAVLLLLEKYALEDPVGSNEIGVFSDKVLQELYDDLIESGNVSQTEALMVGTAVEEIDILDLLTQLDSYVDNEDIELVYESLLKGSRNHLRAFVKNLANKGITYAPRYMSQEAYDEIINSEMENGK